MITHKENANSEVFISLYDFQDMIIQLIYSGDYKKYTDYMHTTNRPEFEAGFIQGLVWGSMLTTNLNKLYLSLPEKDTNYEMPFNK